MHSPIVLWGRVVASAPTAPVRTNPSLGHPAGLTGTYAEAWTRPAFRLRSGLASRRAGYACSSRNVPRHADTTKAQGQNRTGNLLITNQPLFQLSYSGMQDDQGQRVGNLLSGAQKVSWCIREAPCLSPLPRRQPRPPYLACAGLDPDHPGWPPDAQALSSSSAGPWNRTTLCWLMRPARLALPPAQSKQHLILLLRLQLNRCCRLLLQPPLAGNSPMAFDASHLTLIDLCLQCC